MRRHLAMMRDIDQPARCTATRFVAGSFGDIFWGVWGDDAVADKKCGGV
jgi:hypothetical protein